MPAIPSGAPRTPGAPRSRTKSGPGTAKPTPRGPEGGTQIYSYSRRNENYNVYKVKLGDKDIHIQQNTTTGTFRAITPQYNDKNEVCGVELINAVGRHTVDSPTKGQHDYNIYQVPTDSGYKHVQLNTQTGRCRFVKKNPDNSWDLEESPSIPIPAQPAAGSAVAAARALAAAPDPAAASDPAAKLDDPKNVSDIRNLLTRINNDTSLDDNSKDTKKMMILEKFYTKSKSQQDRVGLEILNQLLQDKTIDTNMHTKITKQLDVTSTLLSGLQVTTSKKYKPLPKPTSASTKKQTINDSDPRHRMIELNPGLFQREGSEYTTTDKGELLFNTDSELDPKDPRHPKIVTHGEIDNQKLQTKTEKLTKLDNQFTFINNKYGDSMQKAAILQSDEKLSVFVMNPANASKPGGGACDGKHHGAMEENICRESDLLSSLAHVFNTKEKKKPYLPTATQAIVSTNTYRFNDEYKPTLNFLSIASPDLKRSKHHTGYHRGLFDKDSKSIDSNDAKKEYKNLMKTYWTTALAATIEHANDSTTPVLVATPPGDYLKTDGENINNDYVMIAAEALKEVINSNESFQKVQIVFARKTDQTDIFSKLLLNQH